MRNKYYRLFFKDSIEGSIIKSSVSVFIFVIIVLSMSLSYYVRQAYYKTIADNLGKQLITAVTNYEKNNLNLSLETNILLDLENFSDSTHAQVQILDTDGKILMDNLTTIGNDLIDTSDFKEAKLGVIGEWIGNVSYDKAKVISVAYPIRNHSTVIGVVRFIVSLNSAHQNINKIVYTFIISAILALIIYILFIKIVANRIVDPIKSLIKVAESMAKGRMDIRCEDLPQNEVGTLGETLNYMAEEIEKKDELKNDFISTVSHELRTPLTSIKGWAITMEYDKDDKELIGQGIEIIKDEAERLSQMVEELLDFSKFISNKVELKYSSVKLNSVREYILNYVKPRSEREGFDFEINEILQEIELMIDFNRIKQVIINILDNAIKFLKQDGKITVSFKINSSYDKIFIEFLDNGMGIPKEELPKVKEKFFKGKTSRSKNGLGLSISDEIIKLHKGELDIDSIYGEFTKVSIILPISL